MSFADWMHAHRRSILFLLAMLAIAGLIAAFRLPVTLFPNVDFPRVVASLDAGDRPAEQMEIEVTTPAEEAIRRVPGVKDIRSTTSRGAAELSVNFAWGADMALSASLVNQAVAGLLPQLPAGTNFSVRRMDPTVFPVLSYSLLSDKQSLAKLRDLAQYQLRPLISGIDGVARVEVIGGAKDEFQVLVHPAKLNAYGLTMDDVAKALTEANVIAAVGRIEDHYKLYLGITDTQFKSVDDIRKTILKTGSNGQVRVENIAEVIEGAEPQWTRVNADGHDAVLLQVYQQPGGNSIQIEHEVMSKIDSYKKRLPTDVKIASWYDQSELVASAAASVRDAILIGVVLAALVLFVFLRNGRVTLIAVVVVPVVLASTIVILMVFNMSFNIMTLGSMAAAVGLIIDDAIVMVEHIVRRLKTHASVMESAHEFLRPLTGSSASTIVIFVPLAFLSGVTGAFFKALSITMASGLIISFLVTWLAVPILAEKLLSAKDAEHDDEGKWTIWFHTRYTVLMRRVLNAPILLLAGLLPLLIIGGFAFTKVGTGFMPSMDEGGFVLDYLAPPGTSLAETDRLLRQVEEIIRENKNVATYSRRTGIQLGGGLTEANQGDFFIRLKPISGPGGRAGLDEVMDDIRGDVEKEVPGLEIELIKLMEDLIGDLTAVPQPIEIKIFSDDTEQLQTLAEATEEKISKISGVVDVKNGINPAGDALNIEVDRVKAGFEGVTPDAVSKLVSDALSGRVTTQVRQGIKMVGVRLWVPPSIRSKESDLQKLLLRAPDGHVFPLKRIAKITPVIGQPQISRDNFKRMVAVTARTSGRDIGSAVDEVKKIMDAPGMLPAGVYYELGGLYQQQQIAFKGLLAVFAAAIGLVFLLLLFMYESFRVAISVLVLPLLSVAAVFTGLWITGLELNISAMMGMTMIIGIVTEVAIFYFSEYADMPAHMDRIEALIQADKNRMRPIAMTTIAAILTLLPLAFAIGEGSEMQQALAVAIISGLVVQLPLVLIAMPVFFYLMQGKQSV